MKIILGDNQFFGVNHFDLEKGAKVKSVFDSLEKIENFITISLENGMDGFMINSNEMGYKLLSSTSFSEHKEIHYSIPYPHKYANIVNENGMMSLFSVVFKNTSILKNTLHGLKLFFSGNLSHLTPMAIDLEIPKNLRKGSYIYLQNIITDLLIGMGREDILIKFIKSVLKLGYKPGLITLNPILVDKMLKNYRETDWIHSLILCFNINSVGFNVFPDLKQVENLIFSENNYKTMGMSVFASGSANINSSIEYINSLGLDYVVFGTSKIKNVISNLDIFKS